MRILSPKEQKVHVPCWHIEELLEAQAKLTQEGTLKKIGEWLESNRTYIGHGGLSHFTIHSSRIESLLRGEMP